MNPHLRQKFWRQKQRLFVLLLLTLVLGACGRYRSKGDPFNTPSNVDRIVPIETGGGDPVDPIDIGLPAPQVWSSGGSAVFVPESNAIFNKWVGGYRVEPQNALINVNLKKATNKKTYYGEVKLRYTDAGTTWEATLNSGTQTYDGKDYFMYNYWFQSQGRPVFSGFFEDTIGAIVLIVDQYIDLGDGAGATEIGGEVWFKNFGTTFATYDGGGGFPIVLPCWFRTLGPFDCRSSNVINKSALYPNNGYERLGRFSSMRIRDAFGN